MTAMIDVLMPVRNAEAFVGPVIEGVLEQTFDDLRLIITVDPSDDRSEDVCRAFEKDPRVEVVAQPSPLGWAGASNYLIGRSTAPFRVFAPHDDWIAPECLALMMACLKDNPGAVIASPEIYDAMTGDFAFEMMNIRGAPLRRVLDIMMNQHTAAAYHGLVRNAADPSGRPLIPTDHPSDFEADVIWVARHLAQGDVLTARGAKVLKRFSPETVSAGWSPRERAAANRMNVFMTARFLEIAFPLCRDETDRRMAMGAACVRVAGLGYYGGVAGGEYEHFAARMFGMLALERELRGPAREYLAAADPVELAEAAIEGEGVVKASLLAQYLVGAINRPDPPAAERRIREAEALDPEAGWLERFRAEYEAKFT